MGILNVTSLGVYLFIGRSAAQFIVHLPSTLLHILTGFTESVTV